MASVDSNVLVRLLTEDDPAQFAVITQLLDRLEAEQETLFVPLTVSLELEWVLRSRYGLDKAGVLAAFSNLLETRELAFQDEAILEQALALYRDHRADFAECLHLSAALCYQRPPFLTFDQAAEGLPGTALLGRRRGNIRPSQKKAP
jgi:predicted nucleic-acid-binding protein